MIQPEERGERTILNRNLVFAVSLVALVALSPVAHAGGQDAAMVARGEYLVRIGGCNDCHTEGYAAANGKVPMADWLTGSELGWHGPWGTSYPVNLRLLVAQENEAEWLGLLQTMRPKPPMPWYDVQAMTKKDQRAIYAFIRHLGPAGTPAPSDLPLGATPPPPAVRFVMPVGK